MEDLIEYRVYYKLIVDHMEACTTPLSEDKANSTYLGLLYNNECYDVRIVKETVKREIMKVHILH